ncbi:SDR family oxidoreductase [Thalassobaculum sp.]|uniref:SDR family NAD(P)-dependent oxidoreductase n=1 Tax=Thalassobaculum sp. TaxID=2022740 RepID=UPI0032ECEE0D
MRDDTDFHGQAVLITGGASGIGWAAARAFAQRGARVAIADLTEEAATSRASELGPTHRGVGGDVSDEAAVDRMIHATVEAFGRLDVLINCAGLPDTFTPTIEQTGAHWQRLIDVHLTGTFLMAKRAAVEMMRHHHGVILNISSIAGTHALPRRNAYTAAKHGVIGLTKALACDWAQDGIRVNAVAPGYILTPFIEGLIAQGKLDPKVIRRRTPLGELLPPEEVANAMIFLASPLARTVTGTVVTVDGGYTAFGSPNDAAIIED